MLFLIPQSKVDRLNVTFYKFERLKRSNLIGGPKIKVPQN